MKMSKLIGFFTLAVAALALPHVARAGGDIVDIRVMEQPDKMFGQRGVNTDPTMVCSPDNPFVAGQEIVIRVRMLVRNYGLVKMGQEPNTWFIYNKISGLPVMSEGVGPALGLQIGEQKRFAAYSLTGVEGTNQKSGKLETDDMNPANPSAAYTYFTDFYFKYAVQPGDMGLPIRLLDSTGNPINVNPEEGPAVSSVDLCFLGVNYSTPLFEIRNLDATDNQAELHYSSDTILPVDWPTNPWGAISGVRDPSLTQEGVFVKTIDFDMVGPDGTSALSSRDDVWRYVYFEREGGPTLPTVTLSNGVVAPSNVTFYVWSEDESVVRPVGNVKKVGTREAVLTTILPKDASDVTFRLAGQPGAAVGKTTWVWMSTVLGTVTDPSGWKVETAVRRKVEIVEAPEPTVEIHIDNQTKTSESQTAGSDYLQCKHQLMLTLSSKCDAPVTVKLNATVNGDDDLDSVAALHEANILRVSLGDAEPTQMAKSIDEVTFPANSTQPIFLNLYVLGATDKTGSSKGGVYFTTEIKTAPSEVTCAEAGCTFKILRGNPVLEAVEPEASTAEDESIISVVSGANTAFKFRIADTYKNLNDTETGYTFSFQAEDEDIEPIGLDGYEQDDDTFLMNVKFTGIGTKTLTVKVTAPDGKQSKETLTYTLEVGDSKRATLDFKPVTTVTYNQGVKEESTSTRYVYSESEANIEILLGLTQSYGSTGYIFLKPVDDSYTNLVSSERFTKGAMIASGNKTITGIQTVSFKDDGDVELQAVLSKDKDDITKTVNGYQPSKTLTFTVTNNPPRLTGIYAAGQQVEEADCAVSGAVTLKDPVPRGVAKTFRVSVADVLADLDAPGQKAGELTKETLVDDDAFKVKWEIEDKTYYTSGNPNDDSLFVRHAFLSDTIGKQGSRVTITLKDKDTDWTSAPKFTFYVPVVDQPGILISDSMSGVIPEANGEGVLTSDASVIVELSEKPTADQWVKVTLTGPDAGGIEFSADGSSVIREDDGSYKVKFTTGYPRMELAINRIDGTELTFYNRIYVNAEVVTEGANPDGVDWTAYYMKAETHPIKIQNTSPFIANPTPLDELTTNTFASADTKYTITYSVNDVADDLTNTWANGETRGIEIQVLIDGILKHTSYHTEAFSNGTFQVEFSEGTHLVTVQARDKDEKSFVSQRKVWYYVAPSKRLELRAHGPAVATASTGGYSAFYGGAAGLGAGRVFAGTVGPLSIEDFVHNYSFNKSETAVSLYAYGYKADPAAYDDGTLFGRDWPIDVNGDYDREHKLDPAKDSKDKFYNYVLDTKFRWGSLGYDSFLYAWACNNTESSSSSSTSSSGDTTTTTMSLLLNIGSRGETRVPLGGENQQGGNAANGNGAAPTSYQKQFWEAVFAREYLKTDNCGDINHDGVPDIVVYNYGMGVIDPITHAVASANESNPKADLTDLQDYNDDEIKTKTFGGEAPADVGDYLPYQDVAVYGSLIPSLDQWEIPFGAKLEIRGYGEGLNDAFDLLGINVDGDMLPERLYAWPTEMVVPGAEGADPMVTTNWSWTTECTLSHLEFRAWQEYALAHGLDWTNPADWTKWSPERPTSPIVDDTDGDGYPDGVEYYFWYKAHVGYMDGDVHRYLTGRAYDPRNPGEGRLITSEEIAGDPANGVPGIFDPLVPADAATALTRDSDNDGLPDLLEIMIGTNPLDFDTDGDGLPDGWELMIAGLNPLLPGTSADALMDGERNYDGDAMAITSWKLEENVKPRNLDVEKIRLWTFATIDSTGDTDGVQWYATKTEPAVAVVNAEKAVWSFKSGDRYYVSFEQPLATDDGRLANTLKKGVLTATGSGFGAFVAAGKPEQVTTPIEEPEPDGPTEATNYVASALYPVRLAAGLPISDISDEKVDLAVTTIKTAIKEKDANACWIYGKDPKGSADALAGEVAETAADYGCLALGRQLGVAKDAVVCALPSKDRDVAYLHYLVYQEFGFDPRTAWKAKDPLANRWSKTIDGEAVSGITVIKQGGYTGAPARTRDYTTYDEFLVYSFFLNSGVDMDGVTYIKGSKALDVVKAWGAFTTNPQGPNEPDAIHLEAEGAGDYYFGTINGENGADSDNDGVPDGWELYVMAGPKYKGAYVFAPPYAGFVPALAHDAYKDYEMEKSFFSPFVAAAQTTDTSNQIYLGGQLNDDGLNEFKEFESTDAMNYYADYSTTVIHPGEWTWLNKFFPTDPWSKDTDGDGIDDKTEGSTFVYGTPADDGKLWSIPGGGLNPCSVDTDLDGLPDPWEKQYAGKKESLYAGELVSFAKDADGNPIGNALQGLTDGMDGTVKDAYTYPITYKANESGGTNVTTYVVVDGVNQVVNRDYDRDGLENWQEYLTGTMRCWRYDDPISPWVSIPEEWYWSADPVTGEKSWNPDYGKFGLEDGDEDGFWYMTLVDKSSPYYNPHLITGQNPGVQYFSRVTNAWDCAYSDAVLGKGPAYYHFYDRAGNEKIEDVWVKNGPLQELVAALGKMKTAPSKYVGCSPIDDDSDHDGMDDYYELFHGMNPLLGTEGVASDDGGPFDLVFDAWYVDGSGAPSALAKDKQRNYWHRHPWKTPRAGEKDGSSDLDFTVFPWLNGRQMSDPDGDDILNDEEAIKARLSNKSWHHTDPTPLWMTDSSYPDSLVRQFFRMPTGLGEVELPESGTFTHTDEEGKETVYHFRDFDGFADAELEQRSHQGSPYSFMPFTIDAWKVCGADKMNWIFSFEENEGYDSDHDAIPDHEELESKYRSGTDPQDADSPRRRQAMYFSGPNHPSALQTMPFVAEAHPLGATTYPTDLSFLRYTVECWVMPESLEDATIVERAVYVGESNPGDQEFLRCNFRLAIKDGKWYTKFDPNGTLRGNQVEVFSSGAAKVGVWTHLAATYDGEYLRLYVNGGAEVPKKSGLQPSYGSNAIAHLRKGQGFWYDREYPLKAILVGASFRTNAQGVNDGTALDVTEGRGWDRYCGFYQGYVDEIRIWDGARKPEEIKAAMDVRFDATHAKENRSSFYDSWVQGKYRYEDDGTGTDYDVPAELRFHWTFDSVPAAAAAREVATSPHGFYNGKAPLSRPDGYGIAWWQTVLDGYADTVYCDPAWVQWIPNTVTHLPRFDGTTLDSVYWSEDFMGATAGEWSFAHTAEPVSRWTQMIRNGVSANTDYKTTDSRHQMVNALAETGGRFYMLYEFTGRNLNQTGDDLLPLGGAFVKYLPTEPGVWDGQGASTTWEITGSDGDSDGLPDWWEIYVEENERKRLGRDVTIGWETVIDYHGVPMTAGEAYLRDLAKGVYVDGDGKIHNDLPTEFAQTADEDFNGVPDWWAQMYGIEGESGLADHDNDGLPNYVEYLLSEVFDFNLQFSPVKWDSITQGVPDYFHKVGELYVGEIFTDHDLVDDAWEDLYDSKYASRLAWDAFADADQDGWSNRSEVRYAKQAMPTVSDQQSHYTAADGLVADYPIPTLALKISYGGNRQNTVRTAPMVVQTTTDAKYVRDPDATFMTDAPSEKKDGGSGTNSKEGSASTASAEVAHTRTLGKWSNRHAIGTLTPGNIKINSLALEFCYDPSSVVYSWDLQIKHINGSIEIQTKRGTRSEYDADKRKYGDENVKLLSASPDYAELQDLELRSDEKSSKATWIHTKSGLELGSVNLVTGEFDLNLGVFKDQYVENGTNANDYTSLEDQTFRIAYVANPSVGLPRNLYLGEADVGHVKEGKNTIVAWADLDGDGAWTVGEPYGMVRDVDVSWRGTAAEIELTDLSPVAPRIDLVADAADGRGITHTELAAWIAAHPDLSTPTIVEWLESNPIQQGSIEGASFKGQRVRVVRWLLNDVPVYLSGAPARVVLDKKIETDVRTCLTEADFLIGNEAFDIDWNDLYREVVSDGVVRERIGNVTSVSYLVVVGEGDVDWDKFASSNRVYALNTVITRHFGATRVKPVPIAPGAVGEEIVRSANPTFKWTMDCPEEEGYTTFNVQVLDGSTVIYDSDKQLVPPRNIDGQYVWEAPLYVGDKTDKGKVFENKKAYSWKVSMYNAKYSNTAAYSDVGKFFMEVQTNGYEYGSANVAVRYFGPKDTWAKNSPTIRVRAYTSPDFTGKPVAAGYVTMPSNITNVSEEANCTVIGIPRGTYYLQAFIDSNENGVCDPWETQGYLCTRDGSTPNYLDPMAITFESKVGKGDLAIIYLEDSDIDSDGLPDAWEYAEYGSLTAKGVELLSETKAGEFVVNTNLTGSLALQENAQVPTSGLAGRLAGTGLMSNAGVLALAMGAPTEGYDNFAAAIRGYVSPELVEDGVKITSLDLADGKVTIKVEAETETAGSAWVKGGTAELTVLCQVQWKQSLTSTDWMPLGEPVEITVGTEEAAEIPVEMPDADSGYFSVKVYKK